MKFFDTKFKDLKIFNHISHIDKRGSFKESYKKENFEGCFSYEVNFVQDNLVYSKKNVLRGFHFQKEPYAQSKYITISKGKILDVVIDLRKDEITYKECFSVELSDVNNKSLFIPKGFAHAYLTLSEYAIVNYKVDNFYMKKFEDGIRFNDNNFNIDWGVDHSDIILSEKDKNLNFYIE